MKNTLIIFATSLLIASCSASWHVRRAIKKDPAIFQDTVTVVKVDTLLIDVPVVEWRDRMKRDTLVEYRQGDTVIRYRFNTVTDTLMIQADCPDEKVITKTETKTVTVPINPSWVFWLKLAIFGVILVVVYKILKKNY